MENNTTTATPAKLRDGSWGARVRGTVAAGDVVTITTSAGKTWQATVQRVIWRGAGVSICATAGLDRAATPRPAADDRPLTGWGSDGRQPRPADIDAILAAHRAECIRQDAAGWTAGRRRASHGDSAEGERGNP